MLSTEIKQAIQQKIQQIFPSVNFEGVQFLTPPNATLGHLSISCFLLAKQAQKPAVDFAKLCADALAEDPPCPVEKVQAPIEKVQAVGAYLNFFLAPNFLFEKLCHVLQQPEVYGQLAPKKQKVMIEYSSPNTNKPLHLGHARNQAIGFTLAKLGTLCGVETITSNLVNDRGIHICKSMLAYQKWGQEQTPESANLKGDHFVGQFYVQYHQHQTESLDQECKKMLQDWESKDAAVLKLWQTMNDWAFAGFQQTYQRMGFSFDSYYFESQLFEQAKQLVQEGYAQGLFQKTEDGAIFIDLSAEGLGQKILLRSDQTSMYMTQDLYASLRKFEDHQLDSCIFVVGNEQQDHFKALTLILGKMGYAWAKNLEHLSYGMVELPTGKMKSREGQAADLDTWLDSLKQIALVQLEQREQNQAEPRTPAELQTTAESIAQAATQYFMLRSQARKNIQFNPQASLQFDGETGPYLQYTHARLTSLLNKAKFSFKTDFEPATHPQKFEFAPLETALLLHSLYFPEHILKAWQTRDPAVIAQYAYNLCRKFNKFYYELPVLKAQAEQRQVRLVLSQAVKLVLKKSLDLLNIDALERM